MDTYSQSHLVKSTIGVGDYIASGCTVGSWSGEKKEAEQALPESRRSVKTIVT